VRVPDRRLAPLLDRVLVGFQHVGSGSWLEPPAPAVTIMIGLDGALRADGEGLPRSWVGGLSDRAASVELGARYASLDLKLTPLGAYTLIGCPLSEFARSVVELSDVFGAAGQRLAEDVGEARCWEQRFDLLERFLLERAAAGPAPTPSVHWAWGRLRASGGRVTVEQLARELGCSRRHLAAGFREQIGVPPKTAARLLRFHHVCRGLEREPRRLAELAYEAGYCDQSHLNRDFRELAGTTPTEFVAARRSSHASAGTHDPFVEDST